MHITSDAICGIFDERVKIIKHKILGNLIVNGVPRSSNIFAHFCGKNFLVIFPIFYESVPLKMHHTPQYFRSFGYFKRFVVVGG